MQHISSTLVLSHEQESLLDAVQAGRDVIVDATVGSGKTSAIQALCDAVGSDRRVLYLTYNKLLKQDAQRRVGNAKVQNYHGIVYPSLLKAGLNVGLGESIRTFNENFDRLKDLFPQYDLLVVDEYQDINEEYAQLLRNIRSMNEGMQTVMVGDVDQKVSNFTRLDAHAFARELARDPEELAFTQSFRMGPEMAQKLSECWGKPITGVNQGQQVRYLGIEAAVEELATREPRDVLVLGKRTGAVPWALNELEKALPEVYNKRTAYASIRDQDEGVTYGPDTAVFTTFDSSKGLERKYCYVFDFTQDMWGLRNDMAGADPEILRNIFLVAASRGKSEIIFVNKELDKGPEWIGQINMGTLSRVPSKQAPRWTERQVIHPSNAFDFKYRENVTECFSLLETRRLDDGSSAAIDIDRVDALIDLSPAVGHYQELAFFDSFNAYDELVRHQNADWALGQTPHLTGDPWNNALVLAVADTEQERYRRQVERRIPRATQDALMARLGSVLPRDAQTQLRLQMKGLATDGKDQSTYMNFAGLADAEHEGKLYELKFTTELSETMYLQLALYLVMSGRESGVLWNVRTDERQEVRVPDRQAFMDSVARCVSKQFYSKFVPR